MSSCSVRALLLGRSCRFINFRTSCRPRGLSQSLGVPAVTCFKRRHALTTRLLHIPTAVWPPLIFTGLFVVLWAWKCTMLVLFQNTIIYNPFLPPDARRLTIAEFEKDCAKVAWCEKNIKSRDGTRLSICTADIPPLHQTASQTIDVYILYLQGLAILPCYCILSSR